MIIPSGDSQSHADSPARPLMAVNSQKLSVDGCVFRGNAWCRNHGAISWTISDEADPTGGQFVVRNTLFQDSEGALSVRRLPRVIGFDNCLLQGAGPLIRLANENRSAPLRVHLRQSTLRDSGSLLQWTASAADSTIQPALIVVENSVFAPHLQSAALLEFTEEAPPGWERLLQITGEGSLLRSGAPLITALSRPDRGFVPAY